MIDNTQHFLTREQIVKIAPSVATDHPSPKRSKSYSFISSSNILDVMDDHGFGVTRVKQPKSRESDPRYIKHQLVFRAKDAQPFTDPRYQHLLYDDHGSGHNKLDAPLIYPELQVTNSLDGTSSLMIKMGLFALICSNGLTTSLLSESFMQRHQGFDESLVQEILADYTNRLPTLGTKINTFGDIEMTPDERGVFAAQAAAIRFGAGRMEEPKLLLSARRESDKGNSLWSTYQAVQENGMKGGFKVGKRSARVLTGLDASTNFNRDLWNLAEDFAASKA